MAEHGLELLTWTWPRRSSDYCLVVERPRGACLAGWYGVADMIGRPVRRYGWRGYVRAIERRLRRRLRTADPATEAEHQALLRDELVRHDAYLHDIRSRHDDSAFGFCVCFAAVYGHACRVYNLGDARAWRLRRQATPGRRTPAFAAHALTRDHNGVDQRLRETGSPTAFFGSELLDLSRKLTCFLGIGEAEAVHAAIDESGETFTLEPNECLLLATDGFFMPMIREALGLSEGLTLQSFYLEDWLAQLLAREADNLKTTRPSWSDLVGGLVAEARAGAARHPAYRDDIALLALYRAGD